MSKEVCVLFFIIFYICLFSGKAQEGQISNSNKLNDYYYLSYLLHSPHFPLHSPFLLTLFVRSMVLLSAMKVVSLKSWWIHKLLPISITFGYDNIIFSMACKQSNNLTCYYIIFLISSLIKVIDQVLML